MSLKVVKRLLSALVTSAPPTAYGSMVGSVPAVLDVETAEDELDVWLPDPVPAR
jgi:hypothetical protein